MKMLLRRAALLLAAVVLAATGVTAAPPSALAQDTAAVVVNTVDGSSLWRTMFQIRQVMSDTVDATNAAVAYASCSDCETVAISFQIVLAGAGADTVTPTNLALAVNNECSECLTAAFAYQFVISDDAGPMHFTAEGNQELAAIRQRLYELQNADLSLEELQGELDALADRLRVVLADYLVAVHEDSDVKGGPSPSPSPDAQSDAGTPSPDEPLGTSPTPTSTDEGSGPPSPTETSTTSPTPDPAPTS